MQAQHGDSPRSPSHAYAQCALMQELKFERARARYIYLFIFITILAESQKAYTRKTITGILLYCTRRMARVVIEDDVLITMIIIITK